MICTAVITCHGEGRYLAASVRSARTAFAAAGLDDDNSEILLMVDRPDAVTLAVAEREASRGVEVVEVDFGDPGLSRNAAIERARGHYVALLDGDDLWGRHWIARALAFASDRPDSVFHAQLVVTFPDAFQLWQSPDMTMPDFDVAQLLFDNCWTSIALARTKIFRAIPYRGSHDHSQLGFEDWSWNCDTIAAGYLHRIVPRTVHFIRKREDSQSSSSSRAKALAIPHNLTVTRVRELKRKGFSE